MSPASEPGDDAMTRDEIAGFARTFCKAACQASRHPPIELSWPAVFALEQKDWQDRAELGKVVAAAVARAHADGSTQVERRHLFPTKHQWAPLAEATQRFQQEYLRDALEREGWNVSAVARALKSSRVHIYDLMSEFKIQRPRRT
jgi:DNA-binding NtrC family response regulator